MWRAACLAIAAIVLAGSPDARAHACAADTLREIGARIATERADLRSLAIPEFEETEVPAAAGQLLENLKQDLAVLARAYVESCLPVAPTPVGDDVAEQLKRFVGEDAAGGYGSFVSFEVAVATDRRVLLSVVTTIGIECGSDAMLAVFERDGGQWRERLRWLSPPYRQVSGAFGSFRYSISPADADGTWYVTAAHIKPWCSSAWSSLAFEVLRVGPDPETPRVLLRESHDIWFGEDDLGSITTGVDAVEVRYHGASIDLGIHNRPFVRRYEITGDTIRRTQPVAESARDFVDEWLESDWREAGEWVATEVVARARQVHEEFGPAAHRGGLYEFESIRSCGPSPDATQVALTLDPPGERWYFRVEGRGPYVLRDVTRGTDPACGP